MSETSTPQRRGGILKNTYIVKSLKNSSVRAPFRIFKANLSRTEHFDNSPSVIQEST